MNFSFDKRDDHVVIKLDSKLFTSLVATDARDQIEQLSKEGFKNIILDIEAASFADSTGIGTMVFGNNTCQEKEGKFIVAGMQPHVATVAKVTGITGIMTFAESVEDARKMLS